MSLATLLSRATEGLDAPLVTIEVHLSGGLPGLSIVGLPETAVRESKDRVRAAILNARFEFPARRMTVNLAPADLPKEGGRFDLPIALGILAASGQLPAAALAGYEFLGELALSGELRPVRATLPTAWQTRRAGRKLVLPTASAPEAAQVRGLTVLPSNSLLEVCAHLGGEQILYPANPAPPSGTAAPPPDLDEVRGQWRARRALEIAAAGGHSLLLVGPPGSGKSMLATRLPGLLPPLSEEQALETAMITSLHPSNGAATDWRTPPVRSPHHTASAAALGGGGRHPRPGEISLAHNGVLFLDELPEFNRQALEVLREPLENGSISISRAARQVTFPARVQLVAAMNPCPCGWLGDPSGRCNCSGEQVQRYRNRVSGPLLDRIDMHVEVPRLSFDELRGATGEGSLVVRERVASARKVQRQRGDTLNSQLTHRQIDAACQLNEPDLALLNQATDKLQLSARAYHRILKLARTIADMEHATDIQSPHIAEAISYRSPDRAL